MAPWLSQDTSYPLPLAPRICLLNGLPASSLAPGPSLHTASSQDELSKKEIATLLCLKPIMVFPGIKEENPNSTMTYP